MGKRIFPASCSKESSRGRQRAARKVALPGVLDAFPHEAPVHMPATKRSSDFADLPGLLDRRYGPQPGQSRNPVTFVLDTGPIHAKSAGSARRAAAVNAILFVLRM